MATTTYPTTQEEIKKVCLDGKHKIAILVCVSDSNNNKMYNMFQVSPDEFLVVRGRVDVTEIVEGPYPMSKWDSTYRDKTRENKKPKPYTDQTKLFEDTSISTTSTGTKKNGTMFHSKRHSTIVDFVKNLQHYANESVKENYSVSAANVTKKQVDTAQDKLNEISASIRIGGDVKRINDSLLELYQIIPRKMKQVNDHLVKGAMIGTTVELKIARDMIGREQDTLDVMVGQVQAAVSENASPSTDNGKEFDLLHSLNLEMEICDEREIKMIKDLLNKNATKHDEKCAHRFKRAFRVVNNNTEDRFSKWIDRASNKKKELLWHGSRNENWFSIFQNGLVLKPTNAIITGKMFGNSTYFASKARKSLRYATGGSYAGGQNNTSILALYDVHLGKQMIIKKHKSEHQNLDENKIKKLGYDSVWAMGGYDLVNDEFMVYNENQNTIRYIVEVSQ